MPGQSPSGFHPSRLTPLPALPSSVNLPWLLMQVKANCPCSCTPSKYLSLLVANRNSFMAFLLVHDLHITHTCALAELGQMCDPASYGDEECHHHFPANPSLSPQRQPGLIFLSRVLVLVILEFYINGITIITPFCCHLPGGSCGAQCPALGAVTRTSPQPMKVQDWGKSRWLALSGDT